MRIERSYSNCPEVIFPQIEEGAVAEWSWELLSGEKTNENLSSPYPLMRVVNDAMDLLMAY